MTPPRNHHYVPQFWLKRFADPVGSKMVWSYDLAKDKVEQRSVTVLMAKHDLYTRQTPTGPDTSLETNELGIVDRTGADLLKQVDLGNIGQGLREELADFFAVMALRHPEVVNRFPEATALLMINVQEGLKTTASHADLIAFMDARGYPSFSLDLAEYAQLAAAMPADRDATFDKRFDAAVVPGGDPDIPFADVINTSSGRAIVKARLLSMNWTLASDPADGLVLGDAGVLLEPGDSNIGWTAVLGPNLALLMRRVGDSASQVIGTEKLEPWQVEQINFETTARSKRILVGGSKKVLERVKSNLWVSR